MIKQLLSILAILAISVSAISGSALTINDLNSNESTYCLDANDNPLKTSDGKPIIINGTDDVTKNSYFYINSATKRQVSGYIIACEKNGRITFNEAPGENKSYSVNARSACSKEFVEGNVEQKQRYSIFFTKNVNKTTFVCGVQKQVKKTVTNYTPPKNKVIDEKGDVGINTNSYQCKDKSGKEINPFTNSDGTKNYFSSSLVRLESEKNNKAKYLYLAFSCMVDSDGNTKVTINKNKTPVVLDGKEVTVARSTGPIKGSIVTKK